MEDRRVRTKQQVPTVEQGGERIQRDFKQDIATVEHKHKQFHAHTPGWAMWYVSL